MSHRPNSATCLCMDNLFLLAVTWLMIFLIWGLLFHLWFKVPVAKIASFAGICCAVQLAVTPWLYSARATRQNPSGRITQRVVAIVILFSVTGLLFFYYLHRLNAISVSVVVAFALLTLIIAPRRLPNMLGTRR